MILYKRNCAGRSFRSARPAFGIGMAAAALAAAATPSIAVAQSPYEVQAAIRSADANREISDFYRARGNRPLWIQGNALGREAELFVNILESAELDGLDPDNYRPRSLTRAIERANDGSPRELARAEMMLSHTLVDYVRDVARARDTGMIFTDDSVKQTPPAARAILENAARAPSFVDHVDLMGWMHPYYGQLRHALAALPLGREGVEQGRIVRLNLERARALPAMQTGRYVLVDAASSRLWMYENGRPVDSMRVVVGRVGEPTPMMAGVIRFGIVNPYWNVPVDLARKQIAPAVLKDKNYMRKQRYEVLSGFSDDSPAVPPSEIDWKAVASGQKQVRIRQLPGTGNSMGKMKFMFPNDLGIYLHDTPDKKLMTGEARQFSAGCVRLEDAPRLARWLYGKPLVAKSKEPEQHVALDRPTPIYITYMTAMPEGNRLAFREDVYNRDRVQLAGQDDFAALSR